MSPIVFITGATSGFGKAMACKFAAEGFDVIITGRRNERLEELQEELCKKFNTAVLPLSFDVQDKQSVFQSIETLPEKWRNVRILINNAGLAAGRDFFDEASLDDWDTMIDTNVKGLLYVTKALLPLLIEQFKATGTPSQIINIGSTAGKEVYEKGNVYCASKYAVNALSQAMRIDLLRHQIKVTAIHPGAAETEFSIVRFKGDATQADKVYEGYQALKATDVADVAWYCCTLPLHVCINDLVLTSTAQANSYYLHKTT
ncbi:MAG: SDR family NAD(P)-dependent oxidoreductase [Chitinophagaceae bacterium]|nr:SDR family NAD(P)-dependent oxidoreductase [Chitinophagaceae bacterium]